MDPLVQQLLIATALVSAAVVIHLIGLDMLQFMLRWHLAWFTRWVHLDRLIVPLGIVLGLFVVHGIEIWMYALAYWRWAGLAGLEPALLSSIGLYTTVGEAGGLPVAWRIVGALESINGMLMIGWSTAFLFHILRHLMWEDEQDHELPRGAIARRRKS